MAISIDGADAATHDSVRGVEGSFDRSLRILREAQDAGLATQVNTTLTPDNAGQIDAMADLFRDAGIVLWSVFFLVPVGRAGAAPRLSADACERAFAALWRQSQKQPYLVKTTEAPHYRRFSIQQRRAMRKETASASREVRGFSPMGVNDGKGVMFIGHTGMIYPSGFLPLLCGIYPMQNVIDVYQSSPVFRNLRDAGRLEGKCHRCEFKKLCGGSRARAYAVTGNPFAEEPDCAYVPPARRC